MMEFHHKIMPIHHKLCDFYKLYYCQRRRERQVSQDSSDSSTISSRKAEQRTKLQSVADANPLLCLALYCAAVLGSSLTWIPHLSLDPLVIAKKTYNMYCLPLCCPLFFCCSSLLNPSSSSLSYFPLLNRSSSLS